ncbi:MAG: SDR family NAD(P)-dependent oxidoreductase [Azonexus sp.]
MNPKLVLITGASGGIGMATIRAFERQGWWVLAGTRAPERVVPSERVRPIFLDPASAADRAQIVALVQREFGGRLDCLVNNAGYAQSGPVELIDDVAWRSQMEINVIAPALLTAALLPALRAAQGSIINISSVLGRTGFAWQGAYCASKFALEGWTEALLLETQGQGVRVRLVEPGTTRSNFGRAMKVVEVPSGLYERVAKRFAGLRAQLAERAQPPDRVAAAIIKAATQSHAGFRQSVGKDAWLTLGLLRCLPGGAYFMLSKAIARRFLGLRP